MTVHKTMSRFFLLSLLATAAAAAAAVSCPAGEGDDAPVTVGVLREMFGAYNTSIMAALEKVKVELKELKADVAVIAESVTTPAVGARIEQCARVTVTLLATYDDGKLMQQCSAVPLPATLAARAPVDAETSTYFLTSAHCYEKEITKNPVTYKFIENAVTRVGRTHGCALVAQFFHPLTPDSLDLAVVRCATAVPLPPTRLSTQNFSAFSPVALAGFSRGKHIDPALSIPVVYDSVALFTIALHTKATRLSNSLQTPVAAADGATDVSHSSRRFTEDALIPLAYAPVGAGAAPQGYVELSPWEGMSGGAVFDTHCGLLGITESRAIFSQGGQFVLLAGDVLTRVAAAVKAADAGAGASAVAAAA